MSIWKQWFDGIAAHSPNRFGDAIAEEEARYQAYKARLIDELRVQVIAGGLSNCLVDTVEKTDGT